MEQPTVGFIVYGVHKDGLLDPMENLLLTKILLENQKAP